MTKTTNEPTTDCKECGHSPASHDNAGCCVRKCPCVVSGYRIVIENQLSRLSTLEAAVEERDETINAARQALEGIKQDAYDFINDLAADVQEGGVFSKAEHEKWSRVIGACALLAETAPKVQS